MSGFTDGTAFLVLILVGLVVFGLMSILLPFSAYAAQKWAAKNNEELKALNRKLDALMKNAGIVDKSPQDTSGY